MGVEVQGAGGLPRDGNKVPIQVAATTVYDDATTPTAVTSPFTTTDATVKEFKIPVNAVVIKFATNGADLRVGTNSTLDGTLGDGYTAIPDGNSEAFPCASGESYFARRDAGVDTIIYFSFEILAKVS